MITLWLLRHGEAEHPLLADKMRCLTANGQRDVGITASQLVTETIDLILYSPYVRAKQTADIVIKLLSYQGKIQLADWITPEANPHYVVKKLAEFNEKNILVISHQPLLGLLAVLLTEGNQQFPLSLSPAELLTLKGDIVGLATMQLNK